MKKQKETAIVPVTTRLAPRLDASPTSSVSVYLQAKPRMAPNLRVVLRLLGAEVKGLDVQNFPWESLRYENVSAIRTLLVEHLAPAYARKCLVAVRGVLKVAWRMDQISTDLYHRAIAVDAIKGDSAQAGRMLAREEIAQLLAQAGDPPGGSMAARDAAIIALAVYAGLRREEISALDVSSIIGAGMREITVLGKGKKHRNVFIARAALVYVEEWLARRGLDPGPLFWRGRRGGRLAPGRRLSPSGVWEVIVRVAAEAGVRNVTPHDFRRTYASMLFDAGVDPVTVQKLMGHEDPKTTARYDRRGDEKKIEAADALERALKREDD